MLVRIEFSLERSSASFLRKSLGTILSSKRAYEPYTLDHVLRPRLCIIKVIRLFKTEMEKWSQACRPSLLRTQTILIQKNTETLFGSEFKIAPL